MSGGEAKLLGRWGEALAAEELRKKGWRILAAGYRSRFGEIDLIAADPAFGMTKEELTAHLEPSRYIGRCPEQVEEFLTQEVQPVLEKYAGVLGEKETELKV